MTMLSDSQRDRLIANAEKADQLIEWPDSSWSILRETNAFSSSIPNEYGGTGALPVELQQNMEEIAACCLTTAFALSQREAAIRHFLKGPDQLKNRYLPKMAKGELNTTVGLSQLTTSRQHLGPALRAARQENGGFQLDGEIPWVTGADQANVIVAGATLPDQSQILVTIRADQLKGMIATPLELASLRGSRTSLIHCNSVCIEPDSILAGPSPSVLGKVGGGGLDTSCLAIGLTAAVTRFMRHEAANRPELSSIAQQFESERLECRHRLHELAKNPADPGLTLSLRTDCTTLVLRATQSALMMAKGNGFVIPHPAQRWARQALFFLVWSCPRPVAEGVLAELGKPNL